jgi:hypothetical protein
LGNLYMAPDSRIFTQIIEDDVIMDERHVYNEITSSLKRLLDNFTQQYQAGIEKFHKSY